MFIYSFFFLSTSLSLSFFFINHSDTNNNNTTIEREGREKNLKNYLETEKELDSLSHEKMPHTEEVSSPSGSTVSSSSSRETGLGDKKNSSSVPYSLSRDDFLYCSLTSRLIGVPLTFLSSGRYGSRWVRPYLSPHLLLLIACVCELIAAYYLQSILDRPCALLSFPSLSTAGPLPRGDHTFLFNCLKNAAQVAFAALLLVISFVFFVWSPVYSKLEKLQTSIDPFCSLAFRFLHLYAVGHIIGSVLSSCIIISIPFFYEGSGNTAMAPLGSLLPGFQGAVIFISQLKELHCVFQDCKGRSGHAKVDNKNRKTTKNESCSSPPPVVSPYPPFTTLCFPPLPSSPPRYPSPPSKLYRWLFDSSSAMDTLGLLVVMVVLLSSAVFPPFSMASIEDDDGQHCGISSMTEAKTQWARFDLSLCHHLQHLLTQNVSIHHPSGFPLKHYSSIFCADVVSTQEVVTYTNNLTPPTSSRWPSSLAMLFGIHIPTLNHLLGSPEDPLAFSSSSSTVVHFTNDATIKEESIRTEIITWKQLRLLVSLFWWWVLLCGIMLALLVQMLAALALDKEFLPCIPYGRRKKMVWCFSISLLFASWLLTNCIGSVGEGIFFDVPPPAVGLSLLMIAFDMMWVSYRAKDRVTEVSVGQNTSEVLYHRKKHTHLEEETSSFSCIPLHPSTFGVAKEKNAGMRKEKVPSAISLGYDTTAERITGRSASTLSDQRTVLLPPSLPVLDSGRCAPISSRLLVFFLVSNVFVILWLGIASRASTLRFVRLAQLKVTAVGIVCLAKAILLVSSFVMPSKEFNLMEKTYEDALAQFQISGGRMDMVACRSSSLLFSNSTFFIFLMELLPTILFIIRLLLQLSSSHFQVPILSPVRNAFIDGVYDLCHVGHKRVMKAALSRTRDEKCGRCGCKGGNQLFVGVCGDAECVDYKRLPLMTTAERVKEVESCGFPAVVIPYSPVRGVIREILEYYNIHVVFCGEEYEKAEDTYYTLPRSLGILDTLPRTPGISTSDLLQRIKEREETR